MDKRYIVDTLSLSRIIFGILFTYTILYLNSDLLAIIVIYFLTILSDVLDGKIARKYKIDNKNKGAKVDVLCDFAFIILSSFSLYYINLLPFWFLIIIILKLIEFFKTSSNELEYEKFGTFVALMFYALPGVIVLLNFFKVSITINLILCIVITICAIISSSLRIINKRRNLN